MATTTTGATSDATAKTNQQQVKDDIIVDKPATAPGWNGSSSSSIRLAQLKDSSPPPPTTTTQRQTLPIGQQATILAHRIAKHCKTPQQAISMVLETIDNNENSTTTATTRLDRMEEAATNSHSTTNDHININDIHATLQWEEAWLAVLQLCGKARDYALAVHIIQQHIPNSDQARALAIAICGRCGKQSSVMELLGIEVNQENDSALPSPPPQPQDHGIISTPAPYNAAIAACGTNKTWQTALDIVWKHMPRTFITSRTANAVVTALRKAHRGDEAVDFLKNGFDALNIQRDRNSYHQTMAALMSQGNLKAAIELVLQDMRQEFQTRQDPMVAPNDDTYNRLIAAVVSKRQSLQKAQDGDQNVNPEEIEYYDAALVRLQQAATQVPSSFSSSQTSNKKRKQTSDSTSSTTEPITKRAKISSAEPSWSQNIWDFRKWNLPKRGKGKSAYWELGTFHTTNTTSINSSNISNIIVGLHPNRNPSKNGIQLWFFRDDLSSTSSPPERKKRQKLGYLLMINTPYHHNIHQQKQKLNSGAGTNTLESNADSLSCLLSEKRASSHAGESQFLGLRVTDLDRRQGLAKLFIAVWLQCCRDANLRPITGKMNKPLLCLVLQHSFHFTAVALSGGVRARVLPPPPSSSDSHDNDSQQGIVRLTTESSAVKNLAGVLSPRDLKEQTLHLVPPTEATAPGRSIDVGGLLQAPESSQVMQDAIDKVLQDRWTLSCQITGTDSSVEHERDAKSIANDDEIPMTLDRIFLGT